MDDLSVASVCVQAFDESEGIEVAWNQVKVRASFWRTPPLAILQPRAAPALQLY